MNSSDIDVKTITNMGIYGLHSVMELTKGFCNYNFIWREWMGKKCGNKRLRDW